MLSHRSVALFFLFFEKTQISGLVQVNCPQNDSIFLSLSRAFSILKLYRFVLISAAELFAGSSGKWVRFLALPTLLFVLIVILLLLLLILLLLGKTRITITI